MELEIDETSNRVESEDDEVPQLVHDIAESTKSSITNELRTIISAGNLGDMTTNDMIMLIENKFGIELAKQNKIWFKKVVHDFWQLQNHFGQTKHHGQQQSERDLHVV